MIKKNIIFILIALALLAAAFAVVYTIKAPKTPPTITAAAPSSGPIGTKVTITGSGFASSNDVALRGFNQSDNNQTGYINNVSSPDGKTLTFELPEAVGVCPSTAESCIMIVLILEEGDYEIFVVNKHGESNRKTFKITP